MKEKSFKVVLSFITGAFLAAVIFALAGIYPGSERTLLIFDMREQFVSFYSSLKAVFSGESSFYYTFQGSLGTPYIGMFAYYLASPFSLITLLFDVRDLPDAIWLMDILKCGTICASFSLFIGFRGVTDRIYNLFLSLCYGLSSAAVTFFILPMYLDTLIWLPIICIFLEKLLKSDFSKIAEYKPVCSMSKEEAKSKMFSSFFEMNPAAKNGILYSAFLAACMYTHYYSAFMVCVFLILYSVFIIAEEWNGGTILAFQRITGTKEPSLRSTSKKYLNFIFYSLLAALLASPLLIPVAKELAAGKYNDIGVYSDGSFIVTSFIDLIKQFVCGHYGYLYSEGAPAIYCTLIAVIFAGYGLYTGRKNKAKTFLSAIIVVFLLSSFSLRPLYRVWHMFRDPVAYPHRFAFIFVFFVLILAGDGIKRMEINKKVSVAVLCFGVALLVLNGYKLTLSELQTLPYASRSDYGIFIDTTSDLVECALEDSRNTGNISFCRINKDYEFTSNDPMLLGFNGLDYFASSFDPGMLRFYKNMGFLQYHYKACDAGDTIYTGMILGTDYLIHKGYVDKGFEMITSNGFSTLSRNPYSLGAGYLAAEDCCEFGENPFENVNLYIDSVMGEEFGLLSALDLTVSKQTISFNAPAGQNIYLNFEILNESDLDYEEKSNSDEILVILDDKLIASFVGYQKSYNIFVGNFDEDTECRIVVDGVKEIRQPFIYSLDPDRLMECHDRIATGNFNADLLSAGGIHGTVEVTDPKIDTLVLTVSYSDHFEVYVDGKRSETAAYAGALLSVPDLDPGIHEITITYK